MTNTELTLDQLQAVSGGIIHPDYGTGLESRGVIHPDYGSGIESRGIILPSYLDSVYDETPPELKLATSRLR